MNPNLSPFSNSGVSLKIGQEILFREKGKKYVLLVVDNNIKQDDKIDVGKLFNIAVRWRYQNKRETVLDESIEIIPTETLRFKTEFEYNIRKWPLDPSFAVELFNRKGDGAFFIEDVWPLDIMTEQEMKHRWMRQNTSKYNMEKWNFFEECIAGYNVVKHDLRKPSNMPDSFIYEIRKWKHTP